MSHFVLTQWRIILQCIQIVDGMAFLHSAKRPSLHRDLRCANVIVDKNGKIKVSDVTRVVYSFIVSKTFVLKQNCVADE